MDRPVPHDPERAKALLAEAGYPDGFSVTLDCLNDGVTTRSPNARLPPSSSGVGIEVAINFLSTDEYDAKVYSDRRERLLSSMAGTWTRIPSGCCRKCFIARVEWNVVGYANPRVDELLDKIKGEMVTYARDAYLEEAWRIVTDDVVYLPIRHGVSVFAMRKNLDIPPDPWDVPRFRLARFIVPSGK